MSDDSLLPGESDVPVNPYSLLEAVNDTSEDARTGWFIFLGLMAYLLIAVAGIGHKELLLAKDVELPIISVTVDLQRFFLFAPIALCFLHFGLLIHHAMLARKVLEFDLALKSLEVTSKPRHPLRLELHSYFFTQALAGPQRSLLMRFFLHAQAWLTLVALPVLLLLYIQVSFLPFHDHEITWAHRFTLLADILMLFLVGFFLIRLDTSFLGAIGRTIVHHPITFMFTAVMMCAVALFSVFAATFPGEDIERLAPRLSGALRERIQGVIPFAARGPHDSVFGFRTTLVVRDVDLTNDRAKDRKEDQREARLVLRNRDLRFAQLDRSDLRKADLTGSNLTGASLVGAVLTDALLSCPDLDQLTLYGDREDAGCTILRGANLSKVKAAGARFSGGDLDDANFDQASLEDAEFVNATLKGANFASAHLERADMTLGTSLQGANFIFAQLQGADLSGADLQGADLSNAGLQGTIFATAKLYGANFRGADLDGADLTRTKLAGSAFASAKLFGADFRSASVWHTQPPAAVLAELADLSNVALAPPDAAELTALRDSIASIRNEDVRYRVSYALNAVLDDGASKSWGTSSEHAQWRELAATYGRPDGGTYRDELTGFLGNISCRARWANGSVATGIVKRALSASFKANGESLYTRLQASTCAASARVSKNLLRLLSAAIDNTKGLQTAGTTGALPVPPPVPAGQR
jgi:uncharacterized protein YjbI with pentapeptide repeats